MKTVTTKIVEEYHYDSNGNLIKKIVTTDTTESDFCATSYPSYPSYPFYPSYPSTNPTNPISPMPIWYTTTTCELSTKEASDNFHNISEILKNVQ